MPTVYKKSQTSSASDSTKVKLEKTNDDEIVHSHDIQREFEKRREKLKDEQEELEADEEREYFCGVYKEEEKDGARKQQQPESIETSAKTEETGDESVSVSSATERNNQRKKRKATKSKEKASISSEEAHNQRLLSIADANGEIEEQMAKRIKPSPASAASSSSSSSSSSVSDEKNTTPRFGTLTELVQYQNGKLKGDAPDNIAPERSTAERENNPHTLPPDLQVLVEHMKRITRVKITTPSTATLIGRELTGEEALSIIQQNRVEIPLIGFSHWKKLLKEGGEFISAHTKEMIYRPSCKNGDRCRGRVSEMVDVSIANHSKKQKGITLMAYMSPSEYKEMIEDKDQGKARRMEPRHCVLCQSYYFCLFLQKVRCMCPDVHVDGTLLSMPYRVKYDCQDGFYRTYCEFPIEGKWEGFMDVFPRDDTTVMYIQDSKGESCYSYSEINADAMEWKPHLTDLEKWEKETDVEISEKQEQLNTAVMTVEKAPSPSPLAASSSSSSSAATAPVVSPSGFSPFVEPATPKSLQMAIERRKQIAIKIEPGTLIPPTVTPRDRLLSVSPAPASSSSSSSSAPSGWTCKICARRVALYESQSQCPNCKKPREATKVQMLQPLALPPPAIKVKTEGTPSPSPPPVFQDGVAIPSLSSKQEKSKEDKEKEEETDWYHIQKAQIRKHQRSRKEDADKKTDQDVVIQANDQIRLLSPRMMHDRQASGRHAEWLLLYIKSYDRNYHDHNDDSVLGTLVQVCDEMLGFGDFHLDPSRFYDIFISPNRTEHKNLLFTRPILRTKLAEVLEDFSWNMTSPVARSIQVHVPVKDLSSLICQYAYSAPYLDDLNDTKTIAKLYPSVREWLHIHNPIDRETLVKFCIIYCISHTIEYDIDYHKSDDRLVLYHLHQLQDRYWHVPFQLLDPLQSSEFRTDVTVNERSIRYYNVIDKAFFMTDEEAKRIAAVHIIKKVLPKKSAGRMLPSVLDEYVDFDPGITHFMYQMMMCSLLSNYSKSTNRFIPFRMRAELYRHWHNYNDPLVPSHQKTSFFRWMLLTFPRFVTYTTQEYVMYRLSHHGYLRDYANTKFNVDEFTKGCRELIQLFLDEFFMSDEFKRFFINSSSGKLMFVDEQPSESLIQKAKEFNLKLEYQGQTIFMKQHHYSNTRTSFLRQIRSCVRSSPPRSSSNEKEEVDGIPKQHFDAMFTLMERYLMPCDPYPESTLLMLLPHFGSPPAAISLLKQSIQSCLNGEKIEKSAMELQRQYPYTYATVQAFARMWLEHILLDVQPLPKHFLEPQIQSTIYRMAACAMTEQQEKYRDSHHGLTRSKGKERKDESPFLPVEACCVKYCLACQKIKSYARESRSIEKRTLDTGIQGVTLDFFQLEQDTLSSKDNKDKSLTMWCSEHRQPFYMRGCRATPLARVPILGNVIIHRCKKILKCGYKRCGVEFVYSSQDCYQHPEYGWVCSDCALVLYRLGLREMRLSLIQKTNTKNEHLYFELPLTYFEKNIKEIQEEIGDEEEGEERGKKRKRSNRKLEAEQTLFGNDDWDVIRQLSDQQTKKRKRRQKKTTDDSKEEEEEEEEDDTISSVVVTNAPRKGQKPRAPPKRRLKVESKSGIRFICKRVPRTQEETDNRTFSTTFSTCCVDNCQRTITRMGYYYCAEYDVSVCKLCVTKGRFGKRIQLDLEFDAYHPLVKSEHERKECKEEGRCICDNLKTTCDGKWNRESVIKVIEIIHTSQKLLKEAAALKKEVGKISSLSSDQKAKRRAQIRNSRSKNNNRDKK